jgi:predicted PurR-regulated permease PerM
VFLTFVMVVLALLPLIGASLVWAPAAGYLFVIGDTGLGIALFLYGLVVVSLVDNYARPIVIDREAELNPAVILVGVFGGTYAIGLTGLFIGPIVLAVFVTTIEAFDDEYSTDELPVSYAVDSNTGAESGAESDGTPASDPAPDGPPESGDGGAVDGSRG